MTPPFTDQGIAAVNARVAIAWLKLVVKKRAIRHVKPQIAIGIAVSELDGLQLDMVRLALLSVSVAVGQGVTSSAWLSAAVYGDALNWTFRRCYHAGYKEPRRRDPRVTNRGVTLPPHAGSE